jgi:hypothetical protein
VHLHDVSLLGQPIWCGCQKLHNATTDNGTDASAYAGANAGANACSDHDDDRGDDAHHNGGRRPVLHLR